MARIRKVANYKKGIKNTTQKAFREIATLAEEAVKVMGSRSQNEKVKRLQEANDRLRRDYDSLKKKLESIKSQLASALATGNLEPSGMVPSSATSPGSSKKRWIVSSDEEDSARLGI